MKMLNLFFSKCIWIDIFIKLIIKKKKRKKKKKKKKKKKNKN